MTLVISLLAASGKVADRPEERLADELEREFVEMERLLARTEVTSDRASTVTELARRMVPVRR